MKKYSKPILEMLSLAAEDVLNTSGNVAEAPAIDYSEYPNDTPVENLW